jgi:hypothetical protein
MIAMTIAFAIVANMVGTANDWWEDLAKWHRNRKWVEAETERIRQERTRA